MDREDDIQYDGEVLPPEGARISEGGSAKIAPFPVTPQPVAPSQGDE